MKEHIEEIQEKITEILEICVSVAGDVYLDRHSTENLLFDLLYFTIRISESIANKLRKLL